MNGQSYLKIKRINKENKRYGISLRNKKRFEKKRNYGNSNEYYDYQEIGKIEKMTIINHEHALERIEKYLEQHPKDYYGLSLYSRILVKNKRFEEARMVLDKLESQVKNDKIISADPKKFEILLENIYISNVHYYLYNHQYYMANTYFYKCNHYNNSDGFYNTYFYILKKLNRPELKSFYRGTYCQSQILNYNYEFMRLHIQKHIMRESRDNNNFFVLDFPIDDILNEIKKYLVDENAFYSGFISDVYYFKYDSCGKVFNSYTDYFKVSCFHRTKDIITMLPVTDYNELLVIDLNYMNYSYIDTKAKVKSLEKNGIIMDNDSITKIG